MTFDDACSRLVGLALILRFCLGIDYLQGMTPQGSQLRLRLDHLGLGQYLRQPEHTRRRPVWRTLLGDELALNRGMCNCPSEGVSAARLIEAKVARTIHVR